MDIDGLSPAEKRAMLAELLRRRLGTPPADLEAELHLDLQLAGAAVDLDAPPRQIFLTGGTGFVGAFVLRELLERTDATIHCLVRADSAESGLRRLTDNLRSYGLDTTQLPSRVKAVPGDLSRPTFGLPDADFQALAGAVDSVCHLAALVNLAADYRQLKPTNVEGTREAVRLAALGRVKPLHYLSSYAIFDSIHNVGRRFAERDLPAEHRSLSNGYAESKWVAEGLVRRARSAGLPVSISRVGWVIGDTRTGAWNETDFIPRLLKTFVTTGVGCDFGTMTMTPVDHVARAFVHLSTRKDSLGEIFHLSNGRRVTSRQLLEWLRAAGYRIEEIPIEAWEGHARQSSDELSVTPLLRFIAEAAGGMSGLARWLSKEPDFDVAWTQQRLEARGIVCPPIDQRLMGVYLERFVSRNYIPRPPRT